MKIILTFVFLLTVQSVIYSQSTEFPASTKGLMYSDNTINKLAFIVDSLNLRFKTCDLAKTYYSYPQARHYYVKFKSPESNLKQIISDLENDAGFSQIITKYSAYISSVDSGRQIIRTVSSKKGKEFDYLEGDPLNGYDNVYSGMEKAAGKKWQYQHYPKDKYTPDYSLYCRYFPEEFSQTPIPAAYARLIQYVDCMIDTSTQIYLTNKYSNGWYVANKNEYNNLDTLSRYLNAKMNSRNDRQHVIELSDPQLSFAQNKLKQDTIFKKLLSETIDNYLLHKTNNPQLEELAESLGMYDKALQMKRSYRIMGGCSQDTRPREHARDIAILAAESHNWNVFLRAHLDIMNDRFERASDGSYAWHNRKTYLKELEALNLNIVDLMFGLALRADNVPDNHYYGTIWRLGWALAESKETASFEQKAITAMKDTALDEFNRGLIFLLYKTYISYLDEITINQKVNSLKAEINTFPTFIQKAIKGLELPKTKRKSI